jgi:heat shock protein HslJ
MKAAVASRSAFLLTVLLASACQQVVQPPQAYPQPSAAINASLPGTWELVNVDGLAVRPNAVNVTFDRSGAFTAMVDCNTAQGHYSFDGAQLSFVGWTATERGCEGPLERQGLIEEALRGDGYAVAFTNSSELHLSGKHNLVFRRR